jgi:phytanoyl-CoA hydroxylase
MAQLNKSQVNAFHRDGCITVEDAVTADQLAGMRTAFSHWVEDSRSQTGPFGEQLDGRPRFDVEPGHSTDHPALRRVASPTELADVFLDVLTSSLMTQMAASLIGPNLRLHHSKLNSKLPGTATTVKWHQDFTFDPHSNDDLITCLIFLDDVTPENGPLRVVPGSHKGPLYSLWQNGKFTGAIAPEFVDQLERDAIPQMGKAGSACIMHSRLAHASSANHSRHPRTLFIAAIAAADAIPLAPIAVPSRHAGRLLAGSEPGRIRATNFDIEMPEVPKGASFFDQQSTM